jgi:GT2 family glycosyltransferase
MKIGIVVASLGRAHILAEFLSMVRRQSRRPDELVLSVVRETDLPTDLDRSNLPVNLLFGSPGSCIQRNRGIDYLTDRTDIILFLDDDFWMCDRYLEVLENIFLDPTIVCVTGHVVADGATTPGFQPIDAERILSQYASSLPAVPKFTERNVADAYGCNMAFRSTALERIRFDERLPLYGWQEDVDFSARTRSIGRVIWTDALWGVHLGTKIGKTSGLRFGYSQAVNPFYLVSKGNMTLSRACLLLFKNMAANIRGCVIREHHIDRWGRLRGNLLGLGHLLLGRIDPEFILRL